MKAVRFLVVVTFAFAILGIIASCTLFAGLVAEESGDGSVESDAGDTGAGDAGDGCEHRRWPAQRQNPPGGDDASFMVVGKSIRFTDDPPIGYDLDNTCTCTREAGACALPEGVQLQCDGVGGVDNVAGGLASTFKILVDLQKEANDSITNGETAVLVQVDRYNGGPDDSSVTVSLFRSFGPIRDAGDGGIERVKPTFTLDDEWSIDPDSESTTVARGAKEFGEGYVVDSVIVATLPGYITVHPALRINFQSSVITGRIVKSDGGAGQPPEGVFTLEDVLIVGRWPVDDAIASLAQLTDGPSSKVRVCETTDTDKKLGFEYVRIALCKAVDVAASDKNDHLQFPCNAISGGAAVTTAPAKRGRTLDAATPATPCPVQKKCGEL